MRTFDFYEFAGILAPGTVTLVGFLVLYPPLSTQLHGQTLTLGAFGLIAILAYVLGHLTQAIGNLVEKVWWMLWRGMPTDWVRSGKRDLIAPSQSQALRSLIQTRLAAKLPDELSQLSPAAWYSITRQVYAAVAAQSKTNRIDVFNGNYGLNRGIAAALVIVMIQAAFVGEASLGVFTLMSLGAAIALYRMHRFGVNYGRELFVQFLQLSP
jgi:hypothetical protein